MDLPRAVEGSEGEMERLDLVASHHILVYCDGWEAEEVEDRKVARSCRSGRQGDFHSFKLITSTLYLVSMVAAGRLELSLYE